MRSGMKEHYNRSIFIYFILVLIVILSCGILVYNILVPSKPNIILTINKENHEKNLEVSGLFIYIGYEPNISYLSNFNIFDDEGYIKVNTKYETSVQGLYAVGDNIKNEYYQIITAMSEGTVAALNVAASLNEK